jgi:hypothetical protein
MNHVKYELVAQLDKRINLSVASFSMVSFKVLDLLGRELAALIDEIKSRGSYTATFDAANMPNGVFFIGNNQDYLQNRPILFK